MISNHLYWYSAKLIRVVDGDTIDLELDLGLRHAFRDRFRLCQQAGELFDTPEVRGPSRDRGLEAKAFVEDWIADQAAGLVCRTHQDRRGKYGRWLADLLNATSGERLTDRLLAAGLATTKRINR